MDITDSDLPDDGGAVLHKSTSVTYSGSRAHADLRHRSSARSKNITTEAHHGTGEGVGSPVSALETRAKCTHSSEYEPNFPAG